MIASFRSAGSACFVALLLFSTGAGGDSLGSVRFERLTSLLEEGEHSQAIEEARSYLNELDQQGQANSLLAARALDVLVESLWRTGNATEPETRELGLRALSIKEAAGESEQAGIGKTQHHLAILAFFRGEYPEAQALWESAISNREAALGSEHPDVAESMNGLANLLQMTGDFDDARRLYAKAVEIRTAVFGEQDPRVGHTLNNLASLYTVTADYAAALPVAEQSLEIKRKAFEPGNPEIAIGLVNLADLLDRTGDRERARKLATEAVEILEKALGPDHPEVAGGLNNLAEQYRRAGEYDRARPLFDRALSIWAAQGSDHPDVALALNNLAALEEELGNLEAARELQLRGLAIREKSLGPDHPDVAESLNNLAKLLSRLQQNDAAGLAFQRSLEIRRAAYGPDHPSVAESLVGLAQVEARTGAATAASDKAIESERIARAHLRLTGRTFAEEHALRYAASRSSGLDVALTLAVAARTPARATMDAVIRSRAVVLDEMAERHQAGQGSEDPAVAVLAAELAKARARLANLTVRGPGNLDVEMYREFVADALDTKEKAERGLGAASSGFARQQQRSRQGLEAVAASLPAGSALVSFVQYRHLPDVARLAIPSDPTTQTNEASKANEAGQVVPSPILSYAALVLRSGDSSPVAVPIGATAGIDRLIADWKKEAALGAIHFRRSDEASEAIYRSVAGKLEDLVWTPLNASLKGVDRVFLVPDGALNLVSFGALPTGEASYLVESGPTIHYLSAERDLIPTTDGVRGRGLLALGGPDYDRGTSVDSTLAGSTADGSTAAAASPANDTAGDRATTRSAGCATLQSIQFSPLAAAVAESEEIVQIWASAVDRSNEPATSLSLTGADATEASFKRNAVGKRILHIATHGFFLGGDCTSAPAGGRGFKIVDEPKKAPVFVLDTPVSPLLLSGLALAGANRRNEVPAGVEDGVLTAEEIAALDLNGVEWAVLSACDTGVGEIQAGEGVFGLRRAMQVAGVRTLILSLWPVDDEATRTFMGALYRGRLVDGLDSAESVRRAGRSVLDHRRADGRSTHPFYWAAFVAAGDWR